jgi:hypothetical protein
MYGYDWYGSEGRHEFLVLPCRGVSSAYCFVMGEKEGEIPGVEYGLLAYPEA